MGAACQVPLQLMRTTEAFGYKMWALFGALSGGLLLRVESGLWWGYLGAEWLAVDGGMCVLGRGGGTTVWESSAVRVTLSQRL